MTEQVIIDSHPAQKAAKEGSISKLDTAIEFMWLLIIFLPPLYFNPLENQAFFFAKSLLLQFLTLILLGVVIGQWFLNVRGNSSVRLTDYVKKSPLQVAVICFGLIWIVSSVLSIMPEWSFWGSIHRSNGLITEIYWIVFFFIIAAKMRSSAQIYRALYTLIISAGIVSLIGILQFFNPQILPWFSAGGRIFSTDGNALSLSAFLAMVIPVNLALLILTSYDKSEIRSKKIFKLTGVFAILVLQICCLCLAQYSITLLIFVIGIFVFFTLIGIFLKKRLALALGIITLVSIAVTGVILLGQIISTAKPASPAGSNDPGTTIAEQIGLKTLGARTLIWEAAADIILKSPEVAFYQDNYHFLRKIIGYGPETFIVTIQTVYPTALKSVDTYGANFIAQPENHYLYLGATVGILGLISFLTIIIVFAYQSLKLLIKSTKLEIALIISAFIAAIVQYCAHMLFNPTAIDPELVFWLIMGLAAVFIKLESPLNAIAQTDQENLLKQRHIIPEDKSNIARRIISAVIIVIFVGVALGLTIRPLLADMKLQQALDLWPQDKQMALTTFAEAAKTEAFEASYYGYLGYYAYLKATSSTDSDERTRLLEVSVAAYDLADRMEPHIAYWNYMPADVFTYWAKSGVEDKWPRAIYLYESADGLFPENAVIINKLALALMLRGDYAAAKQKLVQSQEADPSWSQTSFYTGLLNIYENGPGSSAEYFISPVRNGINNIGYFMDFCRKISLYKEIVPIAEELKLYANKKAD
ncbi:MAG: O-antigen ligase family protein, partial [Chloroflexi bacterium]|nr:O-antigen ligase family protein [Chloroflexota bacterium]